jgi:hypothetical protein
VLQTTVYIQQVDTINSRSTELHFPAFLKLFIPYNEIVLLFIKSTFSRSYSIYSSPISYFLLHVSAVSPHQHAVYTPMYVQHSAVQYSYMHISSPRFALQCSPDVKWYEIVYVRFKCYVLDILLVYTYIFIYLFLNAIGLTAGGSSTVHIYTQTVHSTQKTENT